MSAQGDGPRADEFPTDDVAADVGPTETIHHTVADVANWRRDQLAAASVGFIFLVTGIAGFIPFVTTHLDKLSFMGHEEPQAKLLGIFAVSVLHNAVHLGFGIAGQLLARTSRAADFYLIGGGALYLLVFLYGESVNKISSANFLPVNDADNWLHLVVGAGMILLGIATLSHAPHRRK